MEKFKQLIYDQHDIVCNQKYADILPYSFHLKCVEAQGEEFLHLITEDEFEYFKQRHVFNPNNSHSHGVLYVDIVRFALCGHDIIEDGRFTYNDVKELASKLGNTVAGKMVADIVYAVTDEKGKTRAERKSDKYYKELSENKLAVFVKLADISANTLFSKLTGSSMYAKYKSEFAHFKEMCYVEEYKEFFDYLENI